MTNTLTSYHLAAQDTPSHAAQVLEYGLKQIRLRDLAYSIYVAFDQSVTHLHVRLSACGHHAESLALTDGDDVVHVPLSELKNADYNRLLRPSLKAQGVSMTKAGMAEMATLPTEEQLRLAHVVSGAWFLADPGLPLLTHLNAWLRLLPPLQGGQLLSTELSDRQPVLPLHVLAALAEAWKLDTPEAARARAYDRACLALVRSMPLGSVHSASSSAVPGLQFSPVLRNGTVQRSELNAQLCSGLTAWSFRLPADRAGELLGLFSALDLPATDVPLLRVS